MAVRSRLYQTSWKGSKNPYSKYKSCRGSAVVQTALVPLPMTSTPVAADGAAVADQPGTGDIAAVLNQLLSGMTTLEQSMQMLEQGQQSLEAGQDILATRLSATESRIATDVAGGVAPGSSAGRAAPSADTAPVTGSSARSAAPPSSEEVNGAQGVTTQGVDGSSARGAAPTSGNGGIPSDPFQTMMGIFEAARKWAEESRPPPSRFSLDTRGLGRPTSFSSKEGEFQEWHVKFATYMASAFPGSREVLEWAAERTDAVSRGELQDRFGDSVRELSELNNQLYALLLSLCQNEAFDIVNTSPKDQARSLAATDKKV